MSITDYTIRQAGRPANILRSTGTIKTHMMAEATGMSAGKRRADPFTDYEHTFWLPSDTDIVTGEMIFSDGKYYLALSVETKYRFGSVEYYRGMLYECNSLISIFSFSKISKKHDSLVQSGVRCLLTQGRVQDVPSDGAAISARVVPGKDTPLYVYLRNIDGLEKDHIFVDGDGRRFRVSDRVDVFSAGGISSFMVVWER